MCYNCGCHIPQDDMGNPDNLTDSTLKKIAEGRNIPLDKLKANLKTYLQSNLTDDAEFEREFSKAAKAWGQSVEEAKKNTLQLLK